MGGCNSRITNLAAAKPSTQPMPQAQQDAIVAAAAAAAAEARKQIMEGDEEDWWTEYGGDELEAALAKDATLGDSAVRLLDARFLIELSKRGGRLACRQQLPEAAFLRLDDLKRLPKGGDYGDCLRVASVSHAWQQPDNPDPKGLNLKLLADFLEVLLSEGDATCAVFLDFTCLHQKSASGERTPAEIELFGRALTNMMVWYSHPKLLTLS